MIHWDHRNLIILSCPTEIRIQRNLVERLRSRRKSTLRVLVSVTRDDLVRLVLESIQLFDVIVSESKTVSGKKDAIVEENVKYVLSTMLKTTKLLTEL